MSTTPTIRGSPPPPPNTGFQDGGDFTLKSTPEGIEFRVFRLFLMTASPVFQDILTSGSGPPVMELAEDAETISVLLQYIYPRENPRIKDYALFEKVLEAARKYDLGFITSDLRASMRSELGDFAYLRADPLRMYALAVRHDFGNEKLAAAKLTIGKYEFATREGARALTDLDIPTQDAVQLMRMHMGREAALTRLLLSPESNLRYFSGFPVKCLACKRAGGSVSELQTLWMKEMVDFVRKEPFEKANHLFDAAFFNELRSQCACMGCRESAFPTQPKTWTEEAQSKMLELELDAL
ncbi:The BTB (BR-C, ttk and bab)/POZ (Pox virus and Zinc finger) domain [Ceratobasidium sp. AG-Ba]|nr:The BTB (BR-C, ttk and bab)/POZ (Pox virus and Zinc finger) domain [Ceratobasidium sp. AG-Ba]